MANRWEFETKAIHGGFERDGTTGATTVPIYETAAYAYPTAEMLAEAFQGRRFGHIYSRITNPTVAAFEQRVNALEGGRGAVATASGMAAIATVLGSLTEQGDEVVASRSLFGGTYQLFNEVFSRYGVSVNYIEATDVDAYRQAVTPRTRLFFLETLGNPRLDVADIAAIAKVAKENSIPLVADATLTTPYLFCAREFGVNIVIHSATKYMAGNGSALGGVLVDLANYDWTKSRSPRINEMARCAGENAFLAIARRQILQNTGGCLSPFNAFLINLGLETMALRMEKHCFNAMKLAEYLLSHGEVGGVCYPGLPQHPNHHIAQQQFNGKFGAILTLRLGTAERCYGLIHRLKMVKNQANLGDAKTLIIHPASTIYHWCSEAERLAAGAFPDLLRVSVGIENISDIINDFEEALAGV